MQKYAHARILCVHVKRAIERYVSHYAMLLVHYDYYYVFFILKK